MAESTSQRQAWRVDDVILIAMRLWDCRWRAASTSRTIAVFQDLAIAVCARLLRRYLLALATRIKFELRILT